MANADKCVLVTLTQPREAVRGADWRPQAFKSAIYILNRWIEKLEREKAMNASVDNKPIVVGLNAYIRP